MVKGRCALWEQFATAALASDNLSSNLTQLVLDPRAGGGCFHHVGGKVNEAGTRVHEAPRLKITFHQPKWFVRPPLAEELHVALEFVEE